MSTKQYSIYSLLFFLDQVDTLGCMSINYLASLGWLTNCHQMTIQRECTHPVFHSPYRYELPVNTRLVDTIGCHLRLLISSSGMWFNQISSWIWVKAVLCNV